MIASSVLVGNALVLSYQRETNFSISFIRPLAVASGFLL